MTKLLNIMVFALLLIAHFASAQALQGGSGIPAGTALEAEYSAPGIVAEETEVKNKRMQAISKMENLKKKTESLRDKTKRQAQKDRLMGREIALGRFDNAIDKIENNKKLVLDNLPRLESLGIDTSSAKIKLVEIDSKILMAKEVVTEMHELLSSTAENLPKETKDQLSTKAKEAQEIIKEAHGILGELIKNLKAQINQKRMESSKNNSRTNTSKE